MDILPKDKSRHTGEMSRSQRGGTGTRRQASPAPRTKHIPKQRVQVVCE
jgi:hypothetical protein